MANEENLLSRPPERDLDLLSRLRLLLLSRGDRLLLLLLSRGERLRDRDLDGERRPLRPPREPDLDLVTTNVTFQVMARYILHYLFRQLHYNQRKIIED